MTSPAPTAVTPHPKMQGEGPKRLLALDGGGIRGIITLGMLERLETVLRTETGAGPEFRLSDYFDFVGGTSTGAIIATCVSLGMSVKEIQGFYDANGTAMFDKAGLLDRIRNKYSDELLAAKLREVFDGFRPDTEKADGREHITLGTSALKTLLLVVMRNATTDSPWPISNNPFAKYNARDRKDCNLDLPLWQLVRASTAAPTFFPPETVDIGAHRFLFVDGGVTMYNNPAFLLFLMSTIAPYQCKWRTGADDMLLVSIGTGAAATSNRNLDAGDMHLLYNASHIPGALMYAAQNEQDMLSRVFGRCRHGAPLDRELYALTGAHDAALSVPKLFTYVRYNAELSRDGLDALGLADIDPAHVQQMDTVKYMPELKRVGASAAQQIEPAHFTGFTA